jgi:hypothetical protein
MNNQHKEIRNLLVYLAIGQIYLDSLDDLSQTHIWKRETKQLGNKFVKHLENQIKVLFKGGRLIADNNLVTISPILDEEGEDSFLELQRIIEQSIRDAVKDIEFKIS